MNLDNLSMVQLASEIKNKRVSAKKVCQYCLDVCKKTGDLNAFTAIDDDYVLMQADKIDKKIAQSLPIGKLAGVPIGIKDNITTQFYSTTCASNCFKNGILPKEDAAVVQKLKSEDAVIFGKTNMDELAMGFSSTNSAFGEVSNPYAKEYSAGGSSGGSAVAVSVGSVFGALGSDTGGSIRQPAANCGVVGLKPTFNAVSRDGVFPLSKSLDHVGCLAKNVRDCAEIFSVIQKKSINYDACFISQKYNFKVAYLDDFSGAYVDDDVLRAYFDCIATINKIGYKLDGIKFGFSRSIAETYQVLCCVEGVESFDGFNAIHGNVIDMKNCQKEVNKRVSFGKSVLKNDSDAINNAYIVREKTREYILDILDSYDIILSPTTLMRTLKKHEEVSNEKGFTSDLFSIVCNLTGIPALTIPMGLDSNSIPLGLQIMANHNREEDIFAFAFLVEQALSFKKI